ncbi:hypothetical protein Pfo_000709 [Paulownia fortunei]|nr:hypothetical protein Pfo_000709 [Paulownia fortunei]
MNMLEQCRIAPPDAEAELSLLFTFFDMFWLNFHPVQRLLFYEFPCSRSQFIERIIPNVKRSLALALKHFRPFAGKFVHPSGPGMPEIQCKNGDSVSVAFAESHDDFSYLIGNQARDADTFYPLLPELPPVIHVAGSRLIPILAVQVTLFPNLGVSVGLTNQHVVGDARSTISFIKSWASICKFGGDAEFLANKSQQPVYDRCLIKDPNGKLAERYWNDLKRVGLNGSDPQIYPKNKVRATFLMEDANIQKLKNLAAMAMGPDSSHHASTFTVTCGFVWTCLAKSGAAIGEEDGMEYFAFAADYRERLDPPLPANYFGNCVGPLFAKSPRSQLIGNEGFLVAAKLIGMAIYKRFYCNKEEVLKGAEDWPSQLGALDWNRTFGTAGSPRFDVYDADFGWGKPKKFESISIDADSSMSLCKSRDSEKDLEIGLSLPKVRMDAFSTIFSDGLGKY